MRALFTLTLACSALLLFIVQPLVARMLLPFVGGSAATWNVCMVFFQTALLAGYLYAHLLATRVRLPIAVGVHVVLLVLAAATVALAVPSDARPPSSASGLAEIGWLLRYLVTTLGLPVVVIASHAPLLQQWFSKAGGPQARDPYFLYAASNAGSLLALLGYPLLVEPLLSLRQQSSVWTVGYWLLALLVAGAGAAALRSGARNGARADTDPPDTLDHPLVTAPTAGDRMHWLALAAVPSSLVLGATTYISTDLAPVPLLWIVPLALYLTSFIAAFARRGPIGAKWAGLLLPVLALPVALSPLRFSPGALWVYIACHLTFLALAALVCHSELSRRRPAASHVTEFYLWIALGGVLGGVWNAIVAPLLFEDFHEYPLAIVAACLLRPALSAAAVSVHPSLRWRVSSCVGLPVATLLVIMALAALADRLGMEWRAVPYMALVFGPALVVLMLVWPRPLIFGSVLAALMLGNTLIGDTKGDVRYASRNFFGRVRVIDDSDQFRSLIHGTTLHGVESLAPARRGQPLSYYHPSGPLAQVLTHLPGALPSAPAAVIGLGAGTLASFARPGQRWDFYEIDPAVIAVASNPSLFTFLAETPGVARVVAGDGRLQLARAPDASYGVIALDAFSSDSIPIHLLTEDAVALYMRKLRPGGLLLCHISNRYLALEPVLGSTARALDLRGLIRRDTELTAAESEAGKSPSVVVVLAHDDAALAHFAVDSRWQPLAAGSRWTHWRDDHANPLAAIRWK